MVQPSEHLRLRLSAAIKAHVGLPAEFLAALRAHDVGTAAHCTRVGELATRMASEAGLESDCQAAVFWAAILHDVGKLGVPSAILSKPGGLDTSEWDVVRQHPVIGANLLASISTDFVPVADAVRAHHER